MDTLQEFYNANELAELNLKCLPSSSRRIFEKAKRENWKSQKRQGRGGGLEYELISMPEAVQTEIRSRFAVAVVGNKPKAPAVRAEVDLANLTNKQRAVADARMAIIAKVLSLEDSGMSRIKAVEFFCDLAKSGKLPEEMADLVAVANAKKNAKRTLGVRTLITVPVMLLVCCNALSALPMMVLLARLRLKPSMRCRKMIYYYALMRSV